jgi:hypothetical protein
MLHPRQVCEAGWVAIVGNLEMGVRRFIVASRFALRVGLRRDVEVLSVASRVAGVSQDTIFN